jgi:hypothetical protein
MREAIRTEKGTKRNAIVNSVSLSEDMTWMDSLVQMVFKMKVQAKNTYDVTACSRLKMCGLMMMNALLYSTVIPVA